MISDFIYKNYIDPIKYGEPYNIVEILTYAIILTIIVYLLYRVFSNYCINRNVHPLQDLQKIIGTMSKLLLILIGIVIIGALYIIPDPHVMGGMYTIASIASLCENPIFSILGGSECQFYKTIFYGGWLAGIVIIVIGIFSPDSKEG